MCSDVSIQLRGRRGGWWGWGKGGLSFMHLLTVQTQSAEEKDREEKRQGERNGEDTKGGGRREGAIKGGKSKGG